MSAPEPDPKASSPSSTVEEPNYKRPGERGVDYDEYGAEMDPNARVWGVYVKETDKADEELFKGWNGAMDVMLVFAAVFSAILTAFVIESSKDLKPDYSEISARALIIIAKTPPFPGTAPSENDTNTLEAEISNFAPTRPAIVVNMLWFLSLGLSISVTLISMLAKEWCYFFMAGRTGAKFTQGRLRQNRWDGIQHWKMQEIILMLPLLMYTALLLFAIGLSVYLWNINPDIALPVVITTVLTVFYYITTVFLSLLFEHCPYKTAFFKLFHLLLAAVFKNESLRPIFRVTVMKSARLLLHILDFANSKPGNPDNTDINDELEANRETEVSPFSIRNALRGHVDNLEKRFDQMHHGFLISVSKSGKNETLMDKATSAMLSWMITNCEDPELVDIALQALAGADSWLPCKLFLSHRVDFQILRKLQRCLYMLESPHLKSHKTTWNELLDSVHLYSRALATLIRGAPDQLKEQCVSESEWDNCMERVHKILSDIAIPSSHSRVSTSTEYQFGTLLLEGSPAMSESTTDEFLLKQDRGQWKLLEQITTNEVQEFPPSATSVRALVNVITRTLLRTPLSSATPRSPLALVRLFNAYNFTLDNEDAALEHAIGIALTIARFTDTRYSSVPRAESVPWPEATPGNPGVMRYEHARNVYNKLTTEQPSKHRTHALLTFGLLGLLDCPRGKPYQLEEIESIKTALETLDALPLEPRKSTPLVHQDRYLRHLGYHKLMPGTPPTFDLEAQFEAIAKNWLTFWLGPESGLQPYSFEPGLKPEVVTRHLGVLLSPSRCRLFGSSIMDYLIALVPPPNNEHRAPALPIQPARKQTRTLSTRPSFLPRANLEEDSKKLCIQSITLSITDWSDCSRRQKKELELNINKLHAADFPSTMLSLIEQEDIELAPYAMRFLWVYCSEIINSQKSNRVLNDTAGGGKEPESQRPAGEERATDQPNQTASVLHHMVIIFRRHYTCVRDLGYESRWFKLMQQLCEETPQNVIDSGILDELTKDCEDKCYQRPGCRPTQGDIQLLGILIPRDEKGVITMSWPEVYEILKKRCENPDAKQPPARVELSTGGTGIEYVISSSNKSRKLERNASMRTQQRSTTFPPARLA